MARRSHGAQAQALPRTSLAWHRSARIVAACTLIAALLGAGGCVTTDTIRTTQAPHPPASRAPAANAPAAPIRIPSSADAESGRWGKPAASAPAELAQFGQFAGRWECSVEDRDDVGRWTTRPSTAIWTWFYALGGLAVQDVWESRGSGNAPLVLGTNLRLYDPREGVWRAVWTSTDEARFEVWQGAATASRMVMLYGDGDAADRRIEFFDLTADSFRWHYALYRDDGWQLALRSRCQRTAG